MAGSPDSEYLHYRLDVEGDTLKVSLHCCQFILDKTKSNHNNKNFHQQFLCASSKSPFN